MGDMGKPLHRPATSERLTPETEKPKDEDKELDANAVFAKLTALKAKDTEEDE